MDLLALILALTAEKISPAEAEAVLSQYIEEHPDAVNVQVATVAETKEYLGVN